jgi:hypothetical protein
VQYPGEKEVTFPPFTCLESDGEPRLERSEQGELVIFPLKVTSPHDFAHQKGMVDPATVPDKKKSLRISDRF